MVQKVSQTCLTKCQIKWKSIRKTTGELFFLIINEHMLTVLLHSDHHDVHFAHMTEIYVATTNYDSTASTGLHWLVSSGVLWSVCWIAYLALSCHFNSLVQNQIWQPKFWLPKFITFQHRLPKLVDKISSQFQHLVNTGLYVGSLVKWLDQLK